MGMIRIRFARKNLQDYSQNTAPCPDDDAALRFYDWRKRFETRPVRELRKKNEGRWRAKAS